MTSLGGIVITGASTGIGRASAVALAEHGFRVFGGVRSAAAARTLDSVHERLTPLRLDVTRDDEIAAAVTTVRQQLDGAPLAGLMSNAGVFVAAPLEFLPLDDLRRQLETNVIGAVAVTQAFLPLLRAARGRLVLTGSISGILTTPLVGGYCLSKAALESMADSLRQELRPAGIEVSILQPGAVETPLWDKGVAATQEFLAAGDPALHEHYDPMIERVVAMTADYRGKAVAPQEVARAAVHAFTSRRPKARYLVGGGARPQWLLSKLPTRWRDAALRALLHRFG